MEVTPDEVCIIGQGYVGLTLTAVVSQTDFGVVGVEKDDEKLRSLKQGTAHFDEPGLDSAIRSQMKVGSLSFVRSVTAPEAADCETYILTVGSPLNDDGDGADLSILRASVRELTEVLDPGDTVIIRTTISVGTAREMGALIERETNLQLGDSVYLSQAPERTIQGAALEEIRSLPQIIGGYDRTSADKAEQVFNDVSNSLIKAESLEAAELMKLFDNTYRDITIAIGNAFGEIAAAHGLDGQKLIDMANAGYDRNQMKNPGAGVGGGCLPKDPYILLESLAEGSEVVPLARDLVSTARSINESMPAVTCDLINSAIEETGRTGAELTSLVLGTGFKGNPATNDTRNTPAKPIIRELREHGKVDAYDPKVEREKIEALGAEPVSTDDLNDLFSFETYDLLVIANDNPVFRNVDLSVAADEMSADPIVVDGWGTLNPKTAKELGFEYRLVGGDTA
jgi:UDP-N-acetyl-D-mannosaminuronic acid dehydrogenase